MIYLHTESLKIKHTKGSPTPKSEPALLYLTHTTNIKKVIFKKSCRLRVAFSKTIKPTNTDINPHPATIYPTSPDWTGKSVYSLGRWGRHLPNEGYIKSFSDPITDYIPELKDAVPDSKKYHTAKSFTGLTTNMRNLSKIGKLFFNNGICNGV